MKLTTGQKVVVRYTDETSEDFRTVQGAQKGILETVTGCDFAATVESVQIVDADWNEIGVLGCKWGLTLEPK